MSGKAIAAPVAIIKLRQSIFLGSAESYSGEKFFRKSAANPKTVKKVVIPTATSVAFKNSDIVDIIAIKSKVGSLGNNRIAVWVRK